LSERSKLVAALLEDLDHRSPAGFAIALHVRFTRPTFLFQSYPRRWMDHYAAAGLVLRDPTVNWGFHNVGHVRWSDLERIDTGSVLDQARNFGIMYGVAVAIVRNASRSIASFSRSDEEYEGEAMIELESLLAELHDATGPSEDLTPDDHDALNALSVKLTH